MTKMTVKLIIDGKEVSAYHFDVHDQYESAVNSMVDEKLREIAQDFDVRS